MINWKINSTFHWVSSCAVDHWVACVTGPHVRFLPDSRCVFRDIGSVGNQQYGVGRYHFVFNILHAPTRSTAPKPNSG